MDSDLEEPGGDMWRKAGTGFGKEGRSNAWGGPFDQQNHGKRSVTLDLKSPDDMAVFKALLKNADVFVTNVRRAGLERLGIDYPQIKAQLPHLVYCHLNAWGRAGPKQADPGYDYGPFWSASGLADFIRSDDSSDPPRFPGAIGDLTTAMTLVAGIALALFQRVRTGEGKSPTCTSHFETRGLIRSLCPHAKLRRVHGNACPCNSTRLVLLDSARQSCRLARHTRPRAAVAVEIPALSPRWPCAVRLLKVNSSTAACTGQGSGSCRT